VRLTLGDAGDARKRLAQSGIVLASGPAPTIISVRPGSEAARLKLLPGDKIDALIVHSERPNPFLFAIPALFALAGIVLIQRRRRARTLEFAPAT